MASPLEKVCTKCGLTKSLNDFSLGGTRTRKNPLGYRSACKECRNVHAHQYRKNNRHKINEAQRKRKRAARMDPIHSAPSYIRKYSPQIRRKSYNRRYRERQYNLSQAAYLSLLHQQDGRCAICGNHESIVDKRTGQIRVLAVDHDHNTGKVRGLLCFKCNTRVDILEDEDFVNRAQAYLEASRSEVEE